MGDSIDADEVYLVEVVCPACGVADHVGLELRSRLEQVKGEARLGLKVKAGKKDHTCGQMSLTVVAETGEVLRLDLGDRGADA